METMYDIGREMSYPTPLATSPLLPLLLMSLATQKNAPTKTQTTSSIYDVYDYIVVGAGSGGATLAARLSELPCASVLLLEAGGSPPLLTEILPLHTYFFRTDLDWNYTTVPQKHLNNQQFPWFCGKGWGGTSLLNSNLYEKGSFEVYNRWAKDGATGWSYDEVLPYFKKLQNYTFSKYVNNGYHGVNGPVTIEVSKYKSKVAESLEEAVRELGYDLADIDVPRQEGYEIMKGTSRNAQKCSTAKAYLVPAEDRKNLHMLPFAFVHKVIIENNKAVGVSFEVDGVMHEVRAKKEVIVSAGTVNTPKILMLSGIGPRDELEKHGIPVVADLPVGKNLLNFMCSALSYELGPEELLPVKQLMDEQNIRDYIDHRKGPLTSFRFSEMIFHKRDSGLPKESQPNIKIAFTRKMIGSMIKDSVFQRTFDENTTPHIACFAIHVNQKSRGVITLKSANPHDPPLIDPHYFKEDKDVDILAKGLKFCRDIESTEAMKKIFFKPMSIPDCENHKHNENEYLRCLAKIYTFVSNHQVGTAKMGSPTDPSVVVDPQLRVKNVEGLRVVDASVMPDMPGPNINIPVIMIAEKAADMIKHTVQCSAPKVRVEL